MNDLVEIDRGHPPLVPEMQTVAEDLLPVTGSIVSTVTSFESGDWAGGLLGYANTALDTIQVLTDPLGSLASSAVGFLIDHVWPLPQIMDHLVGNPDLVASIGTTWGNVGHALTQASADLAQQGQTCVQSWTGVAATAFDAAVWWRVKALEVLGVTATGLQIGFNIASGIVEAVRTIVTDLVSDLVGRLLAWAAEVALTLGIGASWVVPRAMPTIADTIASVTDFADSLFEAITSGTELVEYIVEYAGELQTLVNGAFGLGQRSAGG